MINYFGKTEESRLHYNHPPVNMVRGSVPGIIFAVSNDGGKTGVAWRESVWDALAYLDLQNVNGGDYAVVAVRKAQNLE